VGVLCGRTKLTARNGSMSFVGQTARFIASELCRCIHPALNELVFCSWSPRFCDSPVLRNDIAPCSILILRFRWKPVACYGHRSWDYREALRSVCAERQAWMSRKREKRGHV